MSIGGSIGRLPLIELAPAYDLINTKVLIDDEEDSALTLNGKKSDFDYHLLIDYFGREICGLNERIITKTLHQLSTVDWNMHILGSRLTDDIGQQYYTLVRQRLKILFEQ